MFMFPWLAVTGVAIVVLSQLRRAGVDAPDWLVVSIVMCFFVFAMVVGTFVWPDWALPPWYRRYRAALRNRAREAELRNRGDRAGPIGKLRTPRAASTPRSEPRAHGTAPRRGSSPPSSGA
jgi:uncharacterized membrane protein YccC